MSDCSDLLRIQRMTTLLNEKEHSMRKLKEALRKSQQQGEESCKSPVFVYVLFLFNLTWHMYTLQKKGKCLPGCLMKLMRLCLSACFFLFFKIQAWECIRYPLKGEITVRSWWIQSCRVKTFMPDWPTPKVGWSRAALCWRKPNLRRKSNSFVWK